MNIAVLSLTRDRLPYTQHCFATLRENAGCEYDHYVLDQGSTDGTGDWLRDHMDIAPVILMENIGINRALNLMLEVDRPRRVRRDREVRQRLRTVQPRTR